MCGIIGRVNFSGKSINLHNLKKATDNIYHRGPDDFGIWNNEFCGFGHGNVQGPRSSSQG